MNKIARDIKRALFKRKVRKELISTFGNNADQEIRSVIYYLKKHRVTKFPYDFVSRYNEKEVLVHYDEQKKLPYTITPDYDKLYFKRSFSTKRVQRLFNALLLEQDEECPHRYLDENFNAGDNDIVADFGAGDGNFSLSIIRKVEKIYLFESDPEWLEPLEATFEPWKNKVEIVNREVSNKDDSRCCKIDTFFRDKTVNFFKIDVEGGESSLLEGAKEVLARESLRKIAICTYHKQADEQEFRELMQHEGFISTPSKGYMICCSDDLNPESPYIRRGLLRAERKGSVISAINSKE